MVRSDQPKTAVGTSGNASLGGAAPPGTTRSRFVETDGRRALVSGGTARVLSSL